MQYHFFLLIIILGYLLGSVPFGLLIGKARGIDIRTVGSKNIGATNVFRTVGKKWGILAFICDFLKGLAGAALVPWLIWTVLLGAEISAIPPEFRLAGGLAAVAGHTWPVWLKFKGGKGVATSFGMLVAVAPSAVGIALFVWIAALLLSRYVSLASILAALALAILVWIEPFYVSGYPAIRILLSILGALVIFRHRSNIIRLCRGNENRFSFRKKVDNN